MSANRLLLPANKEDREELDLSEGPGEAEVSVPPPDAPADDNYGVIVAFITLD